MRTECISDFVSLGEENLPPVPSASPWIWWAASGNGHPLSTTCSTGPNVSARLRRALISLGGGGAC